MVVLPYRIPHIDILCVGVVNTLFGQRSSRRNRLIYAGVDMQGIVTISLTVFGAIVLSLALISLSNERWYKYSPGLLIIGVPVTLVGLILVLVCFDGSWCI
jgi:hypothetical protein